MTEPCQLCDTLEHHAPVIDVQPHRDETPRKQATFAALRLTTRFSQFDCSKCRTRWKWSRAKGWHHEGQRHREAPLIAFTLPRNPHKVFWLPIPGA